MSKTWIPKCERWDFMTGSHLKLNNVFMVAVKVRSAATLLPIIQHVKSGTTVISDQ